MPLMKRTFFWSIPVLAVLGASVWYFSLNSQKFRQPLLQAAAPESPAVRYPITPDGARAESLPALNESDSAMRDALATLFGKDLEKFFTSTASSTASWPLLTIYLGIPCRCA